MRCNNRPGDREAHAQARFLGRVERVEDPLGIGDAASLIDDLCTDLIIATVRPHAEALAGPVRGHGLDAIALQIDEDLLELKAIAPDRRKTWLDLERNENATFGGKIGEHARGLADSRLQKCLGLDGNRLLEKIVRPADHIRGGMGIANYPVDSYLHPVEPWWNGLKPALAGVSVGNGGRQWLIDFMGDGRHTLLAVSHLQRLAGR